MSRGSERPTREPVLSASSRRILGQVANNPGRITRNNGIRRYISSDDTASTDHGALTNSDALEDDGIKTNPAPAFYVDRRARDVDPILFVLEPTRHVIAAGFPIDRVRIVIDEGASPSDKNIITYIDAFGAY